MATNAAPETDQASYRNIWNLAWPQVVMMFFHFTIGFTDVWVAGQIDRGVQAAVGLISQSLFFFLVIAVAVANGSVAAISQSFGAGLRRRALRYIGLVLGIGLVCGAAIWVFGRLFKWQFLAILQVPDEILPVTGYFLDVFLLLLPCYYLMVVTNAVFRAQKLVLIPLASTAIAAGVNAFTDFGFGLGWFGLPNFGFKGVAWATFFSVTASTVFNVCMLHRYGLLKRDTFPPLRWARKALPYLVKVALPSGGMQLLWHLGYMVLFAITASLPFDNVNALAGMTAGMRVESLLFLPAFAFNMTGSILVGNSLGAGRKDEALRIALRLIGIACGSMTVVAVCMYPFIDPLSAFLAPEPAVARQAVNYLIYNLLSIPFTVASMTLGGIMMGAGATIYTFAVYSSATWLVRLPIAYTLGHWVWQDAEGVYLAMLISQVFQSTAMMYILLRRDWYRFSMIKRNNKGCKAAEECGPPPLEGAKTNVRTAV
ncbi:MATE family efflux transporter [Desulfovibrio mangrovi]|uniref:MATE family efflux transporter n=1 Tax=Desulfovibrio mangrovi TaxID=2976983 RepID=UPI0022482930|nr:MATE family efflux transporter [Desulfovibrio mangrovi]UZP69003.1 MATE family efflux transporter [Desulfovibrio mangrovi]